MSWSEQETRERVARLEQVLTGLDAQALDAVAGLADVYGEALWRVFERLPSDAARSLADDELIGHLLLVHGLHPVSVEERIQAALEELRPYLGSHGGGVELVAVDGSTVRLRLEGTCNGCPSSTATLKLAVEDAVRGAAPEIEEIKAEGAVEDAAVSGVPLPLAAAPPGPCPAGSVGAVP